MRRALIGTLAGWLAGAAGVLAQSPLPPGVMPSPYANYNYAPRTAPSGPYYDPAVYDTSRSSTAPTYGPVTGPAYGPIGGPAYGPSYGPSYAPSYGPAYAPVMTAGGMMPPGNAVPLPAPNPIPGDPNAQPGQPLPAPQPVPGPNGGMMVGPNGPMMAGPNGPMMVGPNGMPMNNGGMIIGPNGWWDPNGAPWMNGGCWNGDCGGGCGMPGMPWSRCPNGPCGPEGRVWGSAELLLWWTSGMNVPALLTTGTGPGNPGVLGRPGTTILFGDGVVNDLMRVGVRSRLGFWLDDCQTIGVEGSFFYLGEAETDFLHTCVVGDVVGRPFFNVNPAINAQDAEIVCMPGVLSGSVLIQACTDFYGADANIRRNLCCNCESRVDFIGGFKYLHLADCLSIDETLVNLDPARAAVGAGFEIQDSFGTVNNFYGGQIGLAGECRNGQFFFDWRALLGLGATVKRITIAGQTTFFDPVVGGNPLVQPGGLLALPSNIGTYQFSDFSIVPEVNVNLGYSFTPNIRAYVGYSFMYWTNVARAGDQINLRIDDRQLPTRAGPGVGVDPRFVLVNNDFFAQGINFGIQLRY